MPLPIPMGTSSSLPSAFPNKNREREADERFLSAIFEYRHGHGCALGMGDRKRHPLRANLFGDLGSFSVQQQGGASSRSVSDFDAPPGNASGSARAERLHRGFLGSKPRGKTFNRVLLALAVTNLHRSKNALQKSIAEAGYGGSDPGDFADIDSDADDHTTNVPGP